jgi:hypothetical protein
MIGHDDGSILDVEGIKEVSELSRSYINVSRKVNLDLAMTRQACIGKPTTDQASKAQKPCSEKPKLPATRERRTQAD